MTQSFLLWNQNGNLTNADEIREFLDRDAHRHVNTDSDSELLLNIFANNLQTTGKSRYSTAALEMLDSV